MEPIAITVRKDGEWVLIHRCNGCGTLSSNRTAGDDNPLLLIRIAVKPLAQTAVPARPARPHLRRAGQRLCCADRVPRLIATFVHPPLVWAARLAIA